MIALLTESAAHRGTQCSRGGLGQRLLTAAVFIPCLIVIAWYGSVYYLALVSLFILLGLREFFAIMGAKGLRPLTWGGTLCGSALPWYLYFRGGARVDAVFSSVFIAVLMAEIFRRHARHDVVNAATTVFGILYVGWLGSHIALIRALPLRAGLDDRVGFALVIALFAMTWCCDTGAYAVGRLFGRRKLLPSISPGKTVEGSLGGVAFSVGGILAARAIVALPLTAAQAIAIAVAVSVAAQLGDLFESLIKRSAGVKDSSAAVPGHGGVLDRLDSLLFTAPLFYYFFAYYVLEV